MCVSCVAAVRVWSRARVYVCVLERVCSNVCRLHIWESKWNAAGQNIGFSFALAVWRHYKFTIAITTISSSTSSNSFSMQCTSLMWAFSLLLLVVAVAVNACRPGCVCVYVVWARTFPLPVRENGNCCFSFAQWIEWMNKIRSKRRRRVRAECAHTTNPMWNRWA